MPAADSASSTLSASPTWTAPELAQRQQYLETVGAVASRLAHDFGNLLTGILGFTELSLHRLPSNSPAHQYLTEALRSAEVTRHLLNRLGLFGCCTLSRGQAIDPAITVTAEVERLRPLWQPNVRLDWLPTADVPAVTLMPEHLRQLLVEVLNNAREAIAAEGAVTVRAERVELTAATCADLLGSAQPGPYLEMSVSDTGCGLVPWVRERLLCEPLFSTKPGHRGLGLSVVFGILRAQGGGFRLDEGREEGLVVRLFLPVVETPGPQKE
jgi:signal transduction histidine kinase